MRISNTLTSLLAVAAGVVALGAPALGQVTSDIPLYISDRGAGASPGIDTLRWGVNPAATNGRDTELGEEEQPPAPPEGVFDARWVNVGSSNNLGQGVKKNYHLYASAQQADTFRLRVQPGFQPGQEGYPITLAWSDLSKHFTTANLRFVDGDGNPTTQDMMTVSSFQFSNPSSVSSTVTIVTTAPRSSASVPSAAELAFDLKSVPNPARKESGVVISYTLPKTSAVSITICDALGRTIQRVFEGRQGATEHSFHIDTRELATGSYYCVIAAGETTATRSFVIVE